MNSCPYQAPPPPSPSPWLSVCIARCLYLAGIQPLNTVGNTFIFHPINRLLTVLEPSLAIHGLFFFQNPPFYLSLVLCFVCGIRSLLHPGSTASGIIQASGIGVYENGYLHAPDSNQVRLSALIPLNPVPPHIIPKISWRSKDLDPRVNLAAIGSPG